MGEREGGEDRVELGWGGARDGMEVWGGVGAGWGGAGMGWGRDRVEMGWGESGIWWDMAGGTGGAGRRVEQYW